MSTIQRSRSAIPVFAALLTVALSAPMAVTAQEQVLVEEQVVTAEDQVSVAEVLALIDEPVSAAQEQGPALAPDAGPSWDETSGYGSVEASRATIGHPATSTIGAANDALNPDYLPAALASGQREESAHLASVALPGEAAVAARRTQR